MKNIPLQAVVGLLPGNWNSTLGANGIGFSYFKDTDLNYIFQVADSLTAIAEQFPTITLYAIPHSPESYLKVDCVEPGCTVSNPGPAKGLSYTDVTYPACGPATIHFTVCCDEACTGQSSLYTFNFVGQKEACTPPPPPHSPPPPPQSPMPPPPPPLPTTLSPVQDATTTTTTTEAATTTTTTEAATTTTTTTTTTTVPVPTTTMVPATTTTAPPAPITKVTAEVDIAISGSAADVDVNALIEVTKSTVPDGEGGSTTVVTVDFQVEASVSLKGGITNENFQEKIESIRRSIALALNILFSLVQNLVNLAVNTHRRVLMQTTPTTDGVDVGYTITGIADGAEADKLSSKTKTIVEDNTLAEKLEQEAKVVVKPEVKEPPKTKAKVKIEKTVEEATKGSTSKGVEVEQMLKASVDSGDFQAKLVEKSPAAAATLTVEKVTSAVVVVQSPPPPPLSPLSPPPPPFSPPRPPPVKADSAASQHYIAIAAIAAMGLAVIA